MVVRELEEKRLSWVAVSHPSFCRSSAASANELGLEVIAEGVETEAQARFLMGAGCEQAQGYYFSRPVPADRAAELLRAGRIEPQSGPLRRLTSAA